MVRLMFGKVFWSYSIGEIVTKYFMATCDGFFVGVGSGCEVLQLTVPDPPSIGLSG